MADAFHNTNLSKEADAFHNTNMSKGESRQSCPNPRSLLKKGEDSPLIRTSKEELTTQLIIQFIECKLKPVWTSIKHKKSQLTQSYAFLRSNLRIKIFCFLALILCKHSYAVPMMSKICLPFKNPNCSLDNSLKNMDFILFAITLEINV
jgi:hypothetical protein